MPSFFVASTQTCRAAEGARLGTGWRSLFCYASLDDHLLISQFSFRKRIRFRVSFLIYCSVFIYSFFFEDRILSGLCSEICKGLKFFFFKHWSSKCRQGSCLSLERKWKRGNRYSSLWKPLHINYSPVRLVLKSLDGMALAAKLERFHNTLLFG